MWSYILKVTLGVYLVGSALAQESPQWGAGTYEAPLEGRTYYSYVLAGKWLTPPSAQEAPSSPEMRIFCSDAKISYVNINFGTPLKHHNMNIPFAPMQSYTIRLDTKKPMKLDLEYHLSGDGTVVIFYESPRLRYESILGAKRVVLGATEKSSE